MKLTRPFARAKLARFYVSLPLLVSLPLSIPPAAARAQSAPGAQAQAEREAEQSRRAELEAKALALLEEAAASAAALRLTENRARLLAAAAAQLWPRDEEAARETFRRAADAVASAAASLAPDDPRFDQRYNELQNLRREIAFAVAPREPKIALDFVRSSRPAVRPSAGGYDYYQADQELGLETQLAELIAARDPREAVRLAEESLSRGVSSQLPGLIERVRQTDSQAASKLAADVVRRLRAGDVANSHEASAVATYLLQATRPRPAAQQSAPPQPAPANGPTVFIDGPRAATLPVADSRSLALDEAARRELLALLVNSVLGRDGNEQRRRGGENSHLLAALREVLPEVERLLPAQAQALRRRLGQAEGAEGPPSSPRSRRQEYERLMQAGTVDAILQAAANAPAEMRWQLYRRAAQKAVEEGATERARQIVSEAAVDPRQREQMLRELDAQLFWRAANGGDPQQALALLSRFRSPEERANMTLMLAQSAAARGNHELARQLFEEVLGLTPPRARNMTQFSMRLQAGRGFAGFAPERAFEIAEAGVDHVNELTAAAAQVDGFGWEAFDEGELKLEGNVWSGLIQQASELLAALAPKDFERARDAAGRFQRPEARAHAMLAVARGVLGDGNLPAGRRRGRPLHIGTAVSRQ